MADEIIWLPTSLPVVVDIQERIQQLRNYLNPDHPQYEREEQQLNIRAAIKLYEDGKLDGRGRVCIMEGKVVSMDEVFKGTAWAWIEGMSHQYAQKFAYGNGPFGPHCHELRMLIRLIPERGGDLRDHRYE